jgi:hypothetical protein
VRDVRVLVREDCVRETVVDVPVAGLVSADCIEVSREQKERERLMLEERRERKEKIPARTTSRSVAPCGNFQ